MATKTLFILINDGGDGSFYPRFTFNAEWIAMMDEKDDAGDLCWPTIGCDGDGFHYTTLTVPEECTLESLGIIYDCAVDN